MKFNREVFFEEFRNFYKKKTGKNSVNQTIVNGVDFLLDGFSNWDNLQQIAYAFATVFHETASTMQPIEEYGKGRGKAYGKKDKISGQAPYGRGYVQLTWFENYVKAGIKIGVDLSHNFALALSPSVAFKILDMGMHEGWFAKDKKGPHNLKRYINDSLTDYNGARRIINGTDKASLIAGYAKNFEAMLTSSLIKSDYKSLIKRTSSETATNGNEDLPDNLGAEDSTEKIQEKGFVVGAEEPKAGEAAPDSTAKEGEPVVGGRPEDEPIELKQTFAEKATGLGAWASNIRAQLVSLGIGGFSLGSFAFLTNPTFLWIAGGILIIAVVASATFFLTTMHFKSKEKRQREDAALQITLKEMEIRADPTKYNVKVT